MRVGTRLDAPLVAHISREHWFGDQVALEALVRMGEEEIKHQEMFRLLEAQMVRDMPAGYELEFTAEDRKLDAQERPAAVDDLIGLVGAVDGILQAQAAADARYVLRCTSTSFTQGEAAQIHKNVVKAYRWQYIVSGVMEPRFRRILFASIGESQARKIQNALAPLTYAVAEAPAMQLPMAA